MRTTCSLDYGLVKCTAVPAPSMGGDFFGPDGANRTNSSGASEFEPDDDDDDSRPFVVRTGLTGKECTAAGHTWTPKTCKHIAGQMASTTINDPTCLGMTYEIRGRCCQATTTTTTISTTTTTTTLVCTALQYQLRSASVVDERSRATNECTNCSSVSCPSGQFQDPSTCAGLSDGCTPCTNSVCPTDIYRTGICQGRTDGFACVPCDNTVCRINADRQGVCSGTTNNFTCLACSGNGAPTGDNTGCSCDHGFNGLKCEHSDEKCNGLGKIAVDGLCVCTSAETGMGPTCTEFSNSRTCSGLGIVDMGGRCTCSDAKYGFGPTCSEFNNARTCSDNGVVTKYTKISAQGKLDDDFDDDDDIDFSMYVDDGDDATGKQTY